MGLLVVLLPGTGHRLDVWCWTVWAHYIHEHGLANVYELDLNNYNPLYHYVLWAYVKLAGSAAAIEHYRHYLKAATVVFDLAGAWLVVTYAPHWRRRPYLLLALLLNPGYLYNTLVWEQMDAIWTFFVLAAVTLALRGRLVLSGLLYVLALNTKLQAIVFLPPLLLLWLPVAARVPRRRLVEVVLVAALLQGLLLAPFVLGARHSPLPRILQINFDSAGYFPYITMMAYNVWVLLMQKAALQGTSDELIKLGLSYRHWGVLAFCGAAALALLPLLGLSWRRLRSRTSWQPADMPVVLLALALVPLVFCYFNTEMHERYWHSGVVLLAAYAVRTGRYAAYVAASLAYLLNMESVLGYAAKFDEPSMPAAYPVAVVFTLVIGYCFWQLYAAVRSAPGYFWPWRLAPAEVPGVMTR
ncbi:hypothetical protein B0919_09645 [Hymenobacter sp. CRA2]|nr:hypothetical protein B0919_09645 [Hymenobacter sp. CRA2]